MSIPLERYQGAVVPFQPVYGLPVIGRLKNGAPIRPIAGGDGTAPPMLTADQVSDLVKVAVADAIKAVNTVDDEARPAIKAAPVPLTRRQMFPSLRRAVQRAAKGKLDGYERDFTGTASKLFGWEGGDDDDDTAVPGDGVPGTKVIWPKTLEEALQVFEAMGETKAADRVDGAIKAMTEAVTYTISGGTAGGILVPPEFRQDLFAYALAPRNALRRVPGIRVIPVVGHDIRLPRETTRAGASQASEAGTLSSADATLASQAITIEKQYAMRRWSGELSTDSDPAFSAFLDATVIRDLAIQQDIQWLRGTGSTPQVTGLINYSGLTTSTAAVVAATNGATPDFDDVFDVAYDLDDVNAEADFAVGHPRCINSLRKVKDANGRYLMSMDGTPRGFGAGRDVNGPDAILADFIPFYKTTNLSRTQTVGSSTDCTTIIVGDSKQIVILERAGIELMISPHVYFTTDELAIRALARSAVAILQPTAVALLTGVRP